MLDASTAVARNLRPYGDRLLAVETPVDETTKPSGLIVPFPVEGDREWVRGIVTIAPETYEVLAPGTVIYFDREQSYRLHDAWVVDPFSVIAYEED